MSLPSRRIGPFPVSAIGLGCMNLSQSYLPLPDEATGIALLNRALDLGCTLLDTAAIYGNGANERLLSSIMHRRPDFTLASKCVMDAVDGTRVLDGRPERIVETCERALRRLGTDVIDLYYMHRLDPKVPVEESVGGLARLVEAGKVRAIGLSEVSAETVRRAHATHPIAAVQSEYAAWVRNPEVAVLAACRELGIGFVAFSPLGRGFLAGAVGEEGFLPGDIRRMLPRFVAPQLAHNLTLLARFAALAAESGRTPAQLALGWVLAQGEDIVPIPGTRSIAHLEENLAATPLDSATAAKVDALLAPGAVAGPRYSPALQATIDTELLPEER